jgi:hypothetical protein
MSFAEIQYNLKIMQKTLDQKGTVDQGFIVIFKQAIDSLQESAENKKLVRENLDAARVQILGLDKGELNKGEEEKKSVKRPIEEFALGLTDPLKKDYVMQLNKQFEYWPMAKDGHCLFRSIGTGLIGGLLKKSSVERREFLANLEASVDKLQTAKNGSPLLVKYKKFEAAIKQLDEKKASERMLAHANISDETVMFLRMLSSEYNRTHPTETLNQYVLSSQPNSSVEEYVEQMEQTCAYGGDVEMIALGRTLGIELKVFDVECEHVDYNRPYWNEFKPKDTTPSMSIPLFYSQKNHYDLLVEK